MDRHITSQKTQNKKAENISTRKTKHKSGKTQLISDKKYKMVRENPAKYVSIYREESSCIDCAYIGCMCILLKPQRIGCHFHCFHLTREPRPY